MTTITLWLLIVVSDGVYNRGNAVVVDRFPTADACEHVRRSMPGADYPSYLARCVQATVVKP